MGIILGILIADAILELLQNNLGIIANLLLVKYYTICYQLLQIMAMNFNDIYYTLEWAQ